ncbi:hypothetical protein HTT03_09210 [Sulfitobacter sp. S0837]|nr:hypothetical protein [Sulfitobacter maritimus]
MPDHRTIRAKWHRLNGAAQVVLCRVVYHADKAGIGVGHQAVEHILQGDLHLHHIRPITRGRTKAGIDQPFGIDRSDMT